MATSAPPPKIRLSLSEQLKHFEVNSEGEVYMKMMENITEIERDAYGFRHAALATQKSQDYHLNQYCVFVRMTNKLPINASDDITDNEAFPHEHAKLLVQLRRFLIFVFQYTKPRTRRSGYVEHITYSTLSGFRNSMLFWVKRIYGERGIAPLANNTLFNSMTEAMRYAQLTFGSQKVRTPRIGLSLEELRELFDHEMTTAASIEMSEQMQLAWAIARHTSVRPGAIGASTTRPGEYLQWKDIQLTNQGKGRFQALISFRHIKTNRRDPQHGLEGHRVIKCYLESPAPENMVFSVPHRLLTIAIRRGLLVGINTIKELFETDKVNIEIKAEHLDDPVFYRGKPRGLGVDMPHPLTSAALSQYLADRGRTVGFTQPISFYSIRRRSASDLVQRIGYEATREIMGHAPGTRKFHPFLFCLAIGDMARQSGTLHMTIRP